VKRRVLAIFAKQPLPGQVKTRLAKQIGEVAAARLYAKFVETILAVTESVADQRIIAYSPDTESARRWFEASVSTAGDTLWVQPAGDLGARLTACAEFALSEPEHSLVIIGTDSPTLSTETIAEAFRRLEHNDVVLGPARDGGYYLIGLRSACPRLFAGIDWGTDRVLVQTISRVEEQRLSLHLLPLFYDVDTLEDLKHLESELQASVMNNDQVSPTYAELLWQLQLSMT
jgi:hypothetical protein